MKPVQGLWTAERLKKQAPWIAAGVAALYLLFPFFIGVRLRYKMAKGPYQYEYTVRRFLIRDRAVGAPTGETFDRLVESGAITPMDPGWKVYARILRLSKQGGRLEYRVSAGTRPDPPLDDRGGDLGSAILVFSPSGDLIRRQGTLSGLEPDRLLPLLPETMAWKKRAAVRTGRFDIDRTPVNVPLRIVWVGTRWRRLGGPLPRPLARTIVAGSHGFERHGDFSQLPNRAPNMPATGRFDVYMNLYINGEYEFDRRSGRMESCTVYEQTDREFSTPDTGAAAFSSTITRWGLASVDR